MKKIFTYLSIIVFTISSQAQNHITHWFFGTGAGVVFDTKKGTAIATDAAVNTINTKEGCSSITSPDGTLQFYTDGRTLWNRNHEPMPNTDYSADPNNGLKGDPSSTTSAFIVPKPFSETQYYVFTVDEPHHKNAEVYPNQFTGSYGLEGEVPLVDDGYNNGLNYTLIDMSLNNGLGGVVESQKNKHLVTYNPDSDEIKYKCSEKIAVAQSDNCQGFWVVTYFIDTFYAFKVDESGVNTTPVKSKVNHVQPMGHRRTTIGNMKFNTLGTQLVVAHSVKNVVGNDDIDQLGEPGSLFMYDFDKATGKVNNEQLLKADFGPYGVEFSPNGTKVYATNMEFGNGLYQFDLSNNNQETIITEKNNTGRLGSLQLGPDGKIYAALNVLVINGIKPSLDVITNPNLAGFDCTYIKQGIELAEGTNSFLGLPNYILSPDCMLSNDDFNIESDSFFSIYPNPTSGEMTIHIKDFNEQVELNVLDIRGNILMSKVVKSKTSKLDLGTLSSGLYLLNIKGESSNVFEKIIKK